MGVFEGKKIKENKPQNFWYLGFVLFSLFLFSIFGYFNLAKASNPPNVITYQGKLLSGGAAVTTTQNIKFVLYDSSSAGTALYSASGTTSSPSAVSITLNDGFFTVNLGDSGTNSLDPDIFKNNQSVYLEVIVGSETLSPRKRLTASPFALNAKYLDGISASSTTPTSVHIPVSDSSGNFNFNNVTSSKLYVSGTSTLVTTTISSLNATSGTVSNLNSTGITATNLNITSATFTNATSTGSFWSSILTAITSAFTNLTVTGNSSLATTTMSSSTVTGNTNLVTLTTTGTSTLVTTTISSLNATSGTVSNLNSTGITATNLNITSATFTNATSTGSFWSSILTAITSAFTNLTVTGNSSLATTTMSSSTVGFLNVSNSTTIGGLLSVTGNSSFGTITSGTWNGNAISSVYGGTGQNSSGWTGFVKVTGGTWATSTISTNDLSNSSTIAFLAGNQTFTGNNIFSVTSTFATTTFSGRVGIGTTTPEENLHIYNGNLRIDAPVNPTLVGSYNTTGVTYNIKVSGKYAYVADGASGLEIFDVSFPLSPSLISTYDTAGTAYDVEIVGRYVYVADDTSGLLVIDVEDAINPRLIGSYNTPGNAVAVSVAGKYAYVADQTGGVLIIDVSNPYSPSLISTISATSGDDVYVRGKYAYIADYGGGFKIVDISNPLSPVLATSTGSGLANGVHVIGRYAYVSFNTSTSNNIVAYDISNPISISQTDTFSTTNAAQGAFFSGRYLYAVDTTTFYIFSGGTNSIVGSYSLNDVKALTIVGKYAYISNGTSGFTLIDIKGADMTSADIGSVSTNNLTVWENIDVGNNISVRAGLNVGLGGILSNGPLALSFSSQPTTSLFSVSASSSQIINILGDGKVGIGTSTPQQRLHLYDGTLLVDSPVNPTLSGSVALSSPRSVYVSGKYAYSLGTSGLEIISIEDKTNPSVVSSLSISGISTSFDRSIFVAGRYAYLTANASNTLYVIDVSNPKSPTTTGSVTSNNFLTNAMAVYVSGNYAYVAANNTSTVTIVDIANPTSPMVVGSVTDATKLSSVSAVYVSGRYAYAVGYDNSYFVVIDVIDPNAPSIVGSFTNASNMGGPRSVYVSGKYAYVASAISGSLAVVDITDPTSPFLAGSLTDATNLDTAFGIYVSGKYAYVAARGSDQLSIVDISNSSTPRLIGFYRSASVIDGAVSVFISGKYAYVVNLFTNTNLAIISINGADIHAANIGNITSNDLTVWENSDIGNNLFVRNAINVGVGGIQSNGNFSINSNISSGNLFQIVSSTNSAIFSISASGNVGINTSTFSLGGGTSYKLKIDAGGTGGGAIGANGFIRATAYITPSTTLDLAETYPINMSCTQDGTCPADGDVVCVDPTVVSGVKKCTVSDNKNIIGIVSANPGFLLGGGDFSDPTQNLGTVKVALAGRVPVKVSAVNGIISPGDKLTISGTNGIAAKAIGDVPVVGIAMQEFSGVAEGTVVAFINLGWQNQLYQSLTVNTNSSTLVVGSELTPYNLNLSGELLMFNNVLNKLTFNTTTLFESKTNNTHAFIFNAKNFGTSTDKYLLSLRSNDEPRFSVLSNGDVHTSGNIYAASAVFGTSTNPGDLAERVDVASDEVVEPGDVMVVDLNSPDTYRRSSGSNEQSVAGVISTNPSILVGNGKTSYTAVLAMVGRVPIKVSSENGSINRGDLLVTASTGGYAMKYDPKKDQNEKMIGVIGVALEPFSADKGKILALIRTGWVNSRFETIAKMKDNISQLAVAQGIVLGSTSTASLSVVNNNSGQLAYTGGNLNLGGNMLLNVSSVNGKNNRWSIDDAGHFITRLATSQGEKEMYSIQSPTSEFVFSSSSQLISGEVKIIFDQAVQDVIDFSAPLKINVTLTSGEAKGIYVNEKSAQGFTVKELNDGKSAATFDWIVVAKRKEDVSNFNLNEIISPNDSILLPTVNSTTSVSNENSDVSVSSTTITASTSIQTGQVSTEQPAVQPPSVPTDSATTKPPSVQPSEIPAQTSILPSAPPSQPVVSSDITPVTQAPAPASTPEVVSPITTAPVADPTPPASTGQ